MAEIETKKHKICSDCYATGIWGGQAITESTCEFCGKTIVNGSTNVDKVCNDCAYEHNVCAHCGKKMNDGSSRV